MSADRRRPLDRAGAPRARAALALVLAALAAAIVASSALVSVPAAGEAGPRPERPNFVVIVLDDLPQRIFRQSASLRRGSTTASVEIVNAFAPTRLCCPARTKVLTGRYAHSHGVRHNAYHSSDLTRDLFGSERRFLERGLESRTVPIACVAAATRRASWASTSTATATATTTASSAAPGGSAARPASTPPTAATRRPPGREGQAARGRAPRRGQAVLSDARRQGPAPGEPARGPPRALA